MMTTKKRRNLPVTTFLISSVFLSIVLPALAGPAGSYASPRALIARHEDDGEHDDAHIHMDMDMDMLGEDQNLSIESEIENVNEHTHPTGIAAAADAYHEIIDSINTSATSAISTSTSTATSGSHSDKHHHDHAAKPLSSPKSSSGHDHNHGSHTPAKVKLDDQAIHALHYFPPTYLDVDFKLDNDSAIFGEEFDEHWDVGALESHKGLKALHALLYYGAYFGLLPISLALRAADHPSHYLANVVFLVTALLGWLAGKAYKAAQENRYDGAVHESFATLLLLVSIGLTIIDSLEVVKRAITFSKKSHDKSWSAFVREVLSSEKADEEDETWPMNRYEMIGLVDEEHDDENQVVFALGDDEDGDENEHEQEDEERHRHMHGEPDEIENLPHYNQERGGRKPRRPSLLIRQWTPPSRNSTGSEGTLHDTPGTSSSNNSFTHKSQNNKVGAYDAHPHENQQQGQGQGQGREHEHGEGVRQGHEEDHVEPIWSRQRSKGWKRATEILLTVIRRSQVVFAYVVFLTEFTEYTGMCRAGLINSCAAHYIKGSIFFWYGVLTFGRYLGAYADLGWAWNKRPGGTGISAEMVECAVIFTYGVTNTWMERFGSSPSDPYTVKQVQHISIAVMFWFAGLSGMLLESRWVRKVMGSFISGGRRDVHEPPTYAFSYNPLPALVIGVTGLAMAAHHQEYVFQVQIHSLWGTLLAGGSLFRFLTYFFLFLRPPVESTLPSRPPTEILTSFGYAAGGIVFMLSNEEIAWAAMRAGWDDMMAFLNFTIALTCAVFCWGVIVMAIKGWAGMRMIRSRSRSKRNNLRTFA
ncbi:uncharacterized protein I303_105991 [Kwoniella dejecticola CBS 10117]|uniref:Cytoplasmic protein n=1 Tax=Kwoniella dejecticola CBS 10117 TaxID=1296121 RepID=A0A1A6A0Z5_9TREE|nr:cytoplasmic protein [Kwoniella dejecticola CBS 10117]OBR83731.1 cytoplasmic protein [Kwoniella dejecticola CBS 10117]